MRCSLCGSEFSEETAHSACRGCGFLKGCDLAKCPRCGFENAPEPGWMRKLFRKEEKQKVNVRCHPREGGGPVALDSRLPARQSLAGGRGNDTASSEDLRKENGKALDQGDLRLDTLEVNQKAKVSFVQMGNRNALRKLIAFGVLPGTELILLQKFPSFVFQIGFSQFSVDRELASCIYVRPCSNGEVTDSKESGAATAASAMASSRGLDAAPQFLQSSKNRGQSLLPTVLSEAKAVPARGGVAVSRAGGSAAERRHP